MGIYQSWDEGILLMFWNHHPSPGPGSPWFAPPCQWLWCCFSSRRWLALGGPLEEGTPWPLALPLRPRHHWGPVGNHPGGLERQRARGNRDETNYSTFCTASTIFKTTTSLLLCWLGYWIDNLVSSSPGLCFNHILNCYIEPISLWSGS